jgi:hypothetical protein
MQIRWRFRNKRNWLRRDVRHLLQVIAALEQRQIKQGLYSTITGANMKAGMQTYIIRISQPKKFDFNLISGSLRDKLRQQSPINEIKSIMKVIFLKFSNCKD